MIESPALPPQNKHSDMFHCLAATAGRPVKFSHKQSEGLLKHVYLLKTSNCLDFSFTFIESRFLKQNATRYRTRSLNCTHENKSDLEHAQLTCGPDSDPRNRILPDLVSSSLFPSPSSFFVLEPPKRYLGTISMCHVVYYVACCNVSCGVLCGVLQCVMRCIMKCVAICDHDVVYYVACCNV